LIFVANGDTNEVTRFRQERAQPMTRPLILSNCDSKVIAGAIAKPLSSYAKDVIFHTQRGGVNDRQLLDNVLDLEAHALQTSNTILPIQLPDFIFWDFLAAFSSGSPIHMDCSPSLQGPQLHYCGYYVFVCQLFAFHLFWWASLPWILHGRSYPPRMPSFGHLVCILFRIV
jgi:hypothetical protein